MSTYLEEEFRNVADVWKSNDAGSSNKLPDMFFCTIKLIPIAYGPSVTAWVQVKPHVVTLKVLVSSKDALFEATVDGLCIQLKVMTSSLAVAYRI